ncbi:DoxX family protein [Flavobacteriaceae bacterium CRH]|nr:DoxX family protein [Flavobacteriaceae bacterium CRH]
MIRLIDTDNSKATILMRIMVGTIFISEGIQKFMLSEIRGVGMFVKIGLPFADSLSEFVGVFEVVCGLLLVIGLFTRLASLPLLIIAITAMITTKMSFIKSEGFLEFLHRSTTDWAMIFGCLFLMLKGAGSWSFDKSLNVLHD